MEGKILKEEIELTEHIAKCYQPGEKVWLIDELSGTLEEREKRHNLLALGRQFLGAAERGDVKKVKQFLESGFPTNFQDPQTKFTALHSAASSRARGVAHILLQSHQCDFLLRDFKGRLASEAAFVFGDDVALARLLRIKERKQGEAQGIQVTRRPRPE
ncbi:MAG: hypothetical protein AB2826_22625 [Candidatus Thiodiazotropha sp.]